MTQGVESETYVHCERRKSTFMSENRGKVCAERLLNRFGVEMSRNRSHIVAFDLISTRKGFLSRESLFSFDLVKIEVAHAL